MSKLSIIIPVYNEKRTIKILLDRVLASPIALEKDVILVDDNSNDGTKELLASIKDPRVRVFYHGENLGKTAALRTALTHVQGDYVLVQDADLEYDPKDYPALLEPLLDGRADAVYGSRFLGGPHRVLFFWHYAANNIFTLLTNILYNVNLTDMGTCFKVFRMEILKEFAITSSGFGFEAEVTAKICKRRLRLYEVPISYSGRTYEEGKKITWLDGWSYLWYLLKYRLMD